MGIQILNAYLVNKIAAGEVIERPASVVKELVENSIDARSTRINVRVERGGLGAIEVEDDGGGINPDDLPLVFKRHATSKILTEKDLYCLNTMGFRGEALAAIAAVSSVELLSRQEPHHGMRICIEGGIEKSIETWPAAEGTRITVRDLFFNTPVRRKFLKTPITEGNHVYDVVSKLALSHPDISFSYSNEKKRYFKTSGSGKIEETVAEIYGLNYLQQYLDVNWQGSRYRVQGLISRPEIRKTHRRMQTFFVNNRLVRSPVLMRALEEAYRGLLLSREYPMAILFLDCPPELVDVNVHPQKAEVKFQDAGEVYRVFYHAIKNKLADYSYRLDDKAGGAAAAGDDSPAESGYTDQPSVSLRPDERIYEPSLSFPVTEGAVVQSASVFSALINEEQFEERSPYTIIGQFDHAYILVQQEQELLLIDQHAAHEKILFNKLQEKILNKQAIAQTMAFPEQLSISVKQMELFEQHADLFPSIGFEIEAIGPEALVIRAAPGFARGQEAVIVSELLEFLEEHPVVEFFHHALSTIACKSAIKAGQRLNMQQMQQVVTELLTSAEWKNCPHGRPTVLQISREELDRRFKR